MATFTSDRKFTIPVLEAFAILARHFDLPGVPTDSDELEVQFVEDFGNHHFVFTYCDNRELKDQ